MSSSRCVYVCGNNHSFLCLSLIRLPALCTVLTELNSLLDLSLVNSPFWGNVYLGLLPIL